MNANGYPTQGVWYPSVQVLAFPYRVHRLRQRRVEHRDSAGA